MNTLVIENRKTITVSYSLAVASALELKLYVPFKPDEMIIRQVTVNNTSGAPVAFNMFCDITNDIIFSAALLATSTLNQVMDLHYPIFSQINSVVRFQPQGMTTGTPLAIVAVIVAFQIEFVKYSPKPIF